MNHKDENIEQKLMSYGAREEAQRWNFQQKRMLYGAREWAQRKQADAGE